MIVSFANGRPIHVGRNLDDNSFHALISGDAKYFKIVVNLIVSCAGTGTDFTLTYKDGTDEYTIENARTIAANTSYSLPENMFFTLARDSQSLRVKASAANQLSVFATVVETMPVQSNQPNFGGQTGGNVGQYGVNGGWMGSK
jgi:hypothetical protein